MTAFNVVRFSVKPGRENDFLDVHRKAKAKDFSGLRSFSLVKTGDLAYCVVGEWKDFGSIVAARPTMIGMLDSFRDCLEDIGNGVTDPISGDAVVELRPAAKSARKAVKAKAKAGAKAKPARKAAKKPAARKPAKKPAKKKKR